MTVLPASRLGGSLLPQTTLIASFPSQAQVAFRFSQTCVARARTIHRGGNGTNALRGWEVRCLRDLRHFSNTILMVSPSFSKLPRVPSAYDVKSKVLIPLSKVVCFLLLTYIIRSLIHSLAKFQFGSFKKLRCSSHIYFLLKKKNPFLSFP